MYCVKLWSLELGEDIDRVGPWRQLTDAQNPYLGEEREEIGNAYGVDMAASKTTLRHLTCVSIVPLLRPQRTV